MSEVQVKSNVKDWVYDHRKPLMAVLAFIAVIVLIIGLSFTWFVNNKSLSTVGKIQAPATLKVLGPNQTAIDQISLSYDEAMKDTIADNDQGTATIRRGFCVESGGEGFELQIANTTNISGLKIKVYRVENTNASAAEATIAGVSGTTTYSWKMGEEVSGFTLINAMVADNESLAKELEDNDPTFEDYKNVQQNARPLYRYKQFSSTDLDKTTDGQLASATNFIIECQWDTKPNVKETDAVYLIARSL